MKSIYAIFTKYIVLWGFFFFMAIGLPVIFAMLAASGIELWHLNKGALITQLMNKIYTQTSSFPLMAVPFFILAGELMNSGFFTKALVNFSRSMLGHLHGGLAYVNIVSSLLFAGLSGSAVADTSALGSMLIPAMEKNGYSRRFAAAVTAASSVIGPIIPPSGLMVLYAFIMNVNIIHMFLGGIIPGVMIAISLCIVTYFMSKRRNFPISNERASAKERVNAFGKAFFPLLTPVILLGGILGGQATPTEAASLAVFYALCLNIVMTILQRKGIVKSGGMSWAHFIAILKRSAIQTSVILLLVGVAAGYSFAITVAHLPEALTSILKGYTENKYVFLFIVNLLLFLVGMVLDAGPAILILGPILSGMAAAYGVDPVHFAILMCVNVTVGLATPPMGLVLFVAATVAREKFVNIVKEIIPFLIAEIIVIFMITYIPILTLGLPRLYDMMTQ
ncbi:MAG: TRAP transporter large permease [Alphaproteobacteria bacterium]